MPRLSGLFSSAERAGGAPVEFYTIRRGTRTWLYTSADESVTDNDLTYQSAQISRGPLEQKNDVAGTQVKVALSLETECAQTLMVQSSEPISVSIQKKQSSGDAIKLVLLGHVISVKFAGNDLELTVATIEYLFKTLIPKVLVQRTCPHALYGLSCGVNKDDFAVDTTVTDITGQVITVAASASNHIWRNGILRMASGRVLFIADHTTSAITIWGPVPADLAVSDDVTVYRGCDKLFATCETDFDNAKNFGGFPNLPDRNPAIGTMQ